MLPDQYVWLFWATCLLVFWLMVFIALPGHRQIMLITSTVGSLMGISQPYFVPAYWVPPSVGDLALTTGFDLESPIFCFAIAGLCVGLFNKSFGGQVVLPTTSPQRRRLINRLYLPFLAAPFVFFPLSYPIWSANPIYLAICTLFLGGLSALLCFYETWPQTMRTCAWFLAIYAVPLLAIEWLAPNYTEAVWQLDDLSRIFVAGIPLEEFLFALSYCLCCNGIYMFLLWHRYGRNAAAA